MTVFRVLAPFLGPLLLAGVEAQALGFDLDLYGKLLTQHTREVKDLAGTRVDYAALVKSADWKRLVRSLEQSDPAALGSRDEKLSFWINAYNVLAIDVVVSNHPVASIRDVGSVLRSVWKRTAGRIGGRALSLDEIEHEILRPMAEPRVHGAIVCASLSCPPLAREPFRPERLSAQLDASMARWLADPRKGVRIDAQQNTVHLSSIFKWFEEDFAPRGGVLEFIQPYLSRADRGFLAASGATASIVYLDYDWSLNDLARSPGAS